jgi:hypothetical protein
LSLPKCRIAKPRRHAHCGAGSRATFPKRGLTTETEDRLVIPASSAFFFPLILLGLAGGPIYYGVKTEPTLIPEGLVLIPVSFFLNRSASRPLILDQKADRILGYPMELSKAQKVVVKELGFSDDSAYAIEPIILAIDVMEIEEKKS